ncbi:MAG: ImmA/IrrE family metallo-endopeptidase [Actinobacteria bacterium]|nr:MAG: ImmA/IrrE family metallo-endopeptidase [Actinomycetota bacterium]
MPRPTRSRPWSEPLVIKLIERHRGRAPEEIIERHAGALRRQAGQDRLPVDVELVASVQGVESRHAPHDFAGRIYADLDGQLVMDLNDDDRSARQRFTCAHELIHLAFPGFRKETRYRLDTKQPGQNARNAEEEYLCDLGAATLLMPRDLVEDLYSLDEGLQGVERLASDADVSLQAAGNRLASLYTGIGAFLVFEWSHKPADRPALRRGEDVPQRLRVRYGSVAGVDTYVPRFKSAADESVFSCAWRGWRRERGRELLPGGERLGPFEVEAQAYGTENRVVLATARRA